jgi:signal transduction histidine kinase
MAVAARRNAAGQTEFTLACAVVLFRVAGLVEIGIVTGQNASCYRGHSALIIGMLAAIVAESAFLCTACLRARQVRAWWAVADLVFTIVVLVAFATVTARYGGLYVAYPYSVICSLAFGVGLRRLSTVLGATACLAAAYIYGGGHLHADPAANVMVNTITYFPNTVVTWAVCRQLRRMACELEASRSREAMLARDEERLRHARMLHDRVLQTMETLPLGQWIADAAMKARVAEDAAWLRGIVEGADQATEGDLVSQLSQSVARAARDGLRVEFNYATLRGSPILGALDSGQTAALAGAVGEALTNVAKHAATSSAVLRLAATPSALVVTVLDQGRGFDPTAQPEGVGLRECIRGRVTEAGGIVRIDTAPGAGTYLEMTMPVAGRGPRSQGEGRRRPVSTAVSTVASTAASTVARSRSQEKIRDNRPRSALYPLKLFSLMQGRAPSE